MEQLTQISVSLENMPGQLGRLCRVLAQAAVNIRGISIADETDFSTIRVIVNDPPAAAQALREAGLPFALHEVLIVEVADQPGALESISMRLGEAGVNVQYMYGTGNGHAGKARLVLRVDDVAAARQALGGS